MTDQNRTTEQGFVQRVFSLDLRSLALFRIALGVLILLDLAFRWSTRGDMYTADGFFTGQLAREYYARELGEHWQQLAWSLYWFSDSVAYVQLLFVAAAISALFMIAGKWTKIATIISWILLVSLHVRNPLITTSGDFLFKMMLFWSMFIPLGARWSFDAKHKNIEHDSVCSFATAGLIIQLFAVYFFPGVAKFNDIWLSGDAMSYVLRLDIYIRDFGRALLEYDSILKLISWTTLFAELIWIWTLFVPWKNGMFRVINMLLFCSFHIGIALSMAIGLFCFICIVAWLPLFPSFVWTRKSELRVLNFMRFNSVSTARLCSELFCGVMLSIVVIWNISNIDNSWAGKLRIPLLSQLVHQTAVFQEFQMFGDPPKSNPWFVYEAQLADGSSVDIFRDEKVQLNRPAKGVEKMPQFHWRRLHRSAVHSRGQVVRQPMLDFMVKRWNENHDDSRKVMTAKLTHFQEDIGPEFNELNFKSQVWGHYRDESQSPGSLIDSILEEDLPF